MIGIRYQEICMRIFDVADRIEEKKILFNIQPPTIDVFKIDDECIGGITRDDTIGLGFHCAYLIMPRENVNDNDEPINMGFITLNEFGMLRGMDHCFDSEWIVGIDYASSPYISFANDLAMLNDQPSINEIRNDLIDLYNCLKIELQKLK